MNVKVKVRNLSRSLPLPKYETALAAGMDVMACFDCGEIIDGEEKPVMVKGYDWFYRKISEFPVNTESVVSIAPGERCLIPTGLKVELPEGYELQVRPRSGLALKLGITVLNSPGTIDADYRGMVCIILINCGNDVFTINHGDKIAQIVLKESPRIEWEVAESLSDTERGEGGFGHTSEDPNRVPSFQVGDQLDNVGKILEVKQDPVTHAFIYLVDTGDGEEETMTEKEILDILL